jgi:hypothetical protein
VPNRLLRFSGAAESEFGEAVEALRLAVSIWASGRTDYRLDALPGSLWRAN